MKKTFAIVGPKVEISFDEAAIDAFMARATLKKTLIGERLSS